jgi:hypothetical protein
MTISAMKKKVTIKDFDIQLDFETIFDSSKSSFKSGIDLRKNFPKNVKDALLHIEELTGKYRNELSEIKEAYIDYMQEWVIARPTVYVARTTDTKYDNEYFTAKTTWPSKDGKKKEIKIYLGKASDFGNDTMSERAREYAKKKMSETLRRRKDMGEI